MGSSVYRVNRLSPIPGSWEQQLYGLKGAATKALHAAYKCFLEALAKPPGCCLRVVHTLHRRWGPERLLLLHAIHHIGRLLKILAIPVERRNRERGILTGWLLRTVIQNAKISPQTAAFQMFIRFETTDELMGKFVAGKVEKLRSRGARFGHKAPRGGGHDKTESANHARGSIAV
jgi:hypothetical protein